MTPTPLDFEQPLLELEKCLDDLISRTPEDTDSISVMQEKLELMQADLYKNLNAWQRVQIARHPSRPYALDYLERCFTDFVELHGDRCFGDDKAMPAGIATLGKYHCVVIMQQKGRNVKENVLRNFGSPHPEGYRKALRLMRLAEKFSLPVITFIDTPGAYPGIGAEERHIAESIAVNLREMMLLKTPIISLIIGEGGSGGALGIGVSDKSLMLENAYYSVISPEGCAAILWKHRKHAPQAAAALKLTAQDLTNLELIDGIIPEPLGGAHYDIAAAAREVSKAILNALEELEQKSIPELLKQRYTKFRKMGMFSE